MQLPRLMLYRTNLFNNSRYITYIQINLNFYLLFHVCMPMGPKSVIHVKIFPLHIVVVPPEPTNRLIRSLRRIPPPNHPHPRKERTYRQDPPYTYYSRTPVL